MGHLRTIVEANWEEDGESRQDRYFLLHWGLKFDMVPDSYENLVPVHYTVGICQNIKSGAIEMFLPDQLKVVGQDGEKIDKIKKADNQICS